VFGDDITSAVAQLAVEPFPGEKRESLDKISSANVYFGARGIAEALRRGADVVVTGRVVDSALVLGPLVAHFGWSWSDYEKLAAGSVVGHVLECGCQTTGGNFTDWRKTPSWENVGFPIAICSADGSAVVTKNAGTGGLVSCQTVTEQLLYEIGDPANYLLPDVVVDFTSVAVSSAGPERVRISGATGRAPTSTYKVCVTRSAGFVLTALLLVPGHEARAKAQRMGEAIVKNGNAGAAKLGLPPVVEYAIDLIGGRGAGYDECVLRLVLAHEQPRVLQIAGLEIPAAALAMAPGICGVGATGRAAPSRRMHQFSLLLDKSKFALKHQVQVGTAPAVAVDDSSATYSSLPSSNRASIASSPKSPSSSSTLLLSSGGARVPLHHVAYGRSGDKGDTANIGIVAREPHLYPLILQQVTEEAVQQHLLGMGLKSSRVQRFEIPKLFAVNFHVHDVLGGGGGSSLMLDKQGKTFAQKLLAMEIAVPQSAKL
jgi:hypothetical protein